jgi:phenylalanyl-tRNA synthetase alpha chain
METYFNTKYQTSDHQPLFKIFDNFSPVVTTKANFDDLLIPANHVSRAMTDTFYLEPTKVLRTHTSAHQTQLLREGHSAFLVIGDCYRRDEIDSTHYPVFHQMEGVRLWNKSQVSQEDVVQNLKETLQGLALSLFGPSTQSRWVDAFFPFTDPSFELEVMYNEKWMECLGSGVIQTKILQDSGRGDQIGWAFGIGLERLAMRLFDIPDIRYFWTSDSRFLDQFKSGKIVTFVPYSKYPPCTKDVSVWISDVSARKTPSPSVTPFHDNDLYSFVRDIAGDLVENVQVIGLSLCLSVRLSVRLSFCLSVCLSVRLFVCLSVVFILCVVSSFFSSF